MISALPPDPSGLATKDDLAVLGSDLRAEMAELGGSLRTEMAELSASLRMEMAELRVEMRDLTSQQTRTLMIGLVLSITALAITQIVLATLA